MSCSDKCQETQTVLVQIHKEVRKRNTHLFAFADNIYSVRCARFSNEPAISPNMIKLRKIRRIVRINDGWKICSSTNECVYECVYVCVCLSVKILVDAVDKGAMT